MDKETQDAVFFNLSVMLEKLLDTVIENQRFLVAIHRSLADQLPGFEATCKRYLEDPPPDIRKVQDQNRMWEAQAKNTLLALRKHRWEVTH